MTEAEARAKWCPFSRTAYKGITVNRLTGIENPDHRAGVNHDIRCLASDCTAWRWTDSLVRPRTALDRDDGFCGLAGKP